MIVAPTPCPPRFRPLLRIALALNTHDGSVLWQPCLAAAVERRRSQPVRRGLVVIASSCGPMVRPSSCWTLAASALIVMAPVIVAVVFPQHPAQPAS